MWSTHYYESACSFLLKTNSYLIYIQGKISASDIQRIAKELGEKFSEREIQNMIDEADRDRKLFFYALVMHNALYAFVL